MENLPRLSYRNDVVAQLKEPNKNKERSNVLKMLYYAVESLYSNGVYIYPNVIELFRINGFKKASLYNDAIFDITNNISKDIKCNLEWINHRSFRKSSAKDKNIIMCYLLFIYHESFIKYLHDFLSKQEPNEEKIKCLISSLIRTVTNVSKYDNKNNQPLTNSNKNKSGKVKKQQRLSTIEKVQKQQKCSTVKKGPKPKDQKKEKDDVDEFDFANEAQMAGILDHDPFIFNGSFNLENEFDNIIPF